MVIDIVTREAWNALEAEMPVLFSGPLDNVFLAYSRTNPCHGRYCRSTFRLDQERHIATKRFSDIAYNFMITPDRTIYEGRGFEAAPSLPVKFRAMAKKSLYIVFIGRFADKPPSDELFELREEFIQFCVQENYIKKHYKEFVI